MHDLVDNRRPFQNRKSKRNIFEKEKKCKLVRNYLMYAMKKPWKHSVRIDLLNFTINENLSKKKVINGIKKTNIFSDKFFISHETKFAFHLHAQKKKRTLLFNQPNIIKLI